jgi:DNA-binding NarL/FixJ family response regulator
MLTMLTEQPSIVLVDNSPAIRSIMQRALGLAFPENPIIICSEPAQALKIVPDLIRSIVITSYSMPSMSGIELCQRIRKCAPETYLIVTTAMLDASIQYACEQAGADACVSKLFALDQLEEMIKEAVVRIQ